MRWPRSWDIGGLRWQAEVWPQRGATGRLFCLQWPLARDVAYLIYPREVEFEQDGIKESPL